MALDLPELPGGGGSVGTWLVQVGFDAIFAAFTGNWLQFLQELLDPWDLWFSSVFSGRAPVGKDSATDDVALFFAAAANPVVALTGLGIRGLEAQGLALSSGWPIAKQLYGNLDTALKADLIRQFGATEGGRQFTQYGYLAGLKNPDSNTPALQGRHILDQLYDNAVSTGKIDPKTGFPYTKPPPPPPPPPPSQKPLPCPPYSAIPDCLPQPPGANPDLDEVGQGAAAAAYWLMIVALYLGNLYEKLSGAPASDGSNPDPVTCGQLSALFGQLRQAIESIQVKIPQPLAIDLGPLDSTIASGLAAIVKAIESRPVAAADPNIKRIADSLNGFPPDDPNAKAKLKSLLDLMGSKYGYPPDLLQLLTD